MFREFIGTLVWLAANGLYIDLRRKGRGGLPRIIFFFMGMPATWLWLFLIPEGKRRKELKPPRDDYAELLAEIRRDRALGAGSREDPEANPEGHRQKSGGPGSVSRDDGRADEEGADHLEGDPHPRS